MDILKDKVESRRFRIEDYFPEFASYRPSQASYGETYCYNIITILYVIQKLEMLLTVILFSRQNISLEINFW